MAGLREILADNMRKIRRKRGLTQAKLAEKAEVSTHFIAMIEIARKFPAPETLDRIAAALGIETYQLFSGPVFPEKDLLWLRQSLLNDIERVVGEAVEKIIAEKYKD
ncbi:MAG: helix-turn-helix transcriptional regulator [Treponema sp.]|jgi:transcriptional regulator with XRE-family HTH domain|nr:helix-turn-helix transcriptional regulator [Treponema sp.]